MKCLTFLFLLITVKKDFVVMTCADFLFQLFLFQSMQWWLREGPARASPEPSLLWAEFGALISFHIFAGPGLKSLGSFNIWVMLGLSNKSEVWTNLARISKVSSLVPTCFLNISNRKIKQWTKNNSNNNKAYPSHATLT